MGDIPPVAIASELAPWPPRGAQSVQRARYVSDRNSRQWGGLEAEQEPGDSRKADRSSTTPLMAELKRRAVARLRELSTALETVRRDHAAAEAECRRLHAVPLQPTPEPAPPSESGAARAQEKPMDDSAIDRVQELASRVQGLRAELQEAQALLAAEQTDSRCLRERERELEARLEELRESSQETESGLLGNLRGRVVSLEVELEHSRAESARLQEAMTRLLGFLDELSRILSISAERS